MKEGAARVVMCWREHGCCTVRASSVKPKGRWATMNFVMTTERRIITDNTGRAPGLHLRAEGGVKNSAVRMSPWRQILSSEALVQLGVRWAGTLHGACRFVESGEGLSPLSPSVCGLCCLKPGASQRFWAARFTSFTVLFILISYVSFFLFFKQHPFFNLGAQLLGGFPAFIDLYRR